MTISGSSYPKTDSRRSLPVRSQIPSAARGPESDAAESRAASLPVPHGRRRYNTLDLASKIVCHGNSLFPLDPLRFLRSLWANVMTNMNFPVTAETQKDPTIIRRYWMIAGSFCRASDFDFRPAGIAGQNQNPCTPLQQARMSSLSWVTTRIVVPMSRSRLRRSAVSIIWA